jgi:hypothetical protein
MYGYNHDCYSVRRKSKDFVKVNLGERIVNDVGTEIRRFEGEVLFRKMGWLTRQTKIE